MIETKLKIYRGEELILPLQRPEKEKEDKLVTRKDMQIERWKGFVDGCNMALTFEANRDKISTWKEAALRRIEGLKKRE